MARARCNARLTAGWLSSSRDAAAVTLFSSAMAANVIRRFKSTCRSLVICGCVSQKNAQGEFNATGKRFATEAGGRGGWVVGDWFGSGSTGGLARSQGRYRLQQRGTNSEGR